MADAFDPYHKWLGIPAEQQPPDHYRLLGISPLEEDPDVIQAAADQRMMILRTYQTGRHSALSQKLLNEVAAAKVCLLRPEKKAEYDQQLRQKLQADAEARIPPPPKTEFVEAAEPVEEAKGPQHTETPAEAVPGIGVSGRRPTRSRKSSLPWQVPALALSLLVVGVLVYALSRDRSSEPPPPPAPPSAMIEFICPQREREGLTLQIDGESRTVPRSGPVQFACKPGEHRYRAERERLGFVPVEGKVTVRAGQRVKITLTWVTAAVLVFDWPEDLRAGAELLVDGRPVTVPTTGRCECRLPPGRHNVVAQRPGFKPIRQTLTLQAGEEKTVALTDWPELPAPPLKPALLVLHWPEDQRAGATLLIDGKPMQVPPQGRCEYSLPPGRRRIVVERPGAERFEQTVMLSEGPETTVEIGLSDSKQVGLQPRESPAHLTLDMEKERFTYDLQTDQSLPEGELYVEVWGPQSWAVPGGFEGDKQEGPLSDKATVKLDGKATVEWSEIPGAEIGVRFIRLADGLKLQTESVYRAGGLRYALTPSRMAELTKTLPANLNEAKARLQYLDTVGPQLSRRRQSLQTQLARELSRPPRSQNPTRIAALSGQIQTLSNDIQKGSREYGRLSKQIPRLERLVQVLPTLDNLVNNLHDSKLYYRLVTKPNDGG